MGDQHKALVIAGLVGSSGGGGGGGTSDYTQLTNKPKINGVTLTGNKSASDLGIDEPWTGTAAAYAAAAATIPIGTPVIITDDIDIDSTPTQGSDNPVTSDGVYTALNGKVDKVTGKGLSTEDYTTAEKTKLAELTNDYSSHTNKPQINNVTLSGNKSSLDLGLLPSSTKYGTSISVTINDSTYVVTAILKDQDGNTLGTAQTIDLPLESMVIGGEYDDTTKKIILTLKNGQTVEFSVADLVAGLQTEITSSNKLNADLVDDINAANKFMTAAEKTKLAGLTNDYANHTNKPSINNVTLSGNKTSSNLGLQAEITASNKLSADLIDDSSTTNKFVSAAEKTSIGTSATKLTGISGSANDYIELVNGLRLYVSSTEPTGSDIPNGSVWLGGET